MSEKLVKEALKKYLKAIGAYYYMPVSMGYGAASIDFFVCYKGKFYGIETKKDGIKEPTKRQGFVLRDIVESGGMVILETSTNLESTRLTLERELHSNSYGPEALKPQMVRGKEY